MQMFFSASQLGFCSAEVYGDDLPEDALPIEWDLYVSLLGKEIEPGPGGQPQAKAAPAPTFEQRKALLLVAVDEHLNAAAKGKGYDSIINAALRAALPASPFHADGVAFGTWMDAVYAKCYEVLAQVVAEEIPEPTTGELIAMLPALVLPE